MINVKIKRLQRKLLTFQYGVVTSYLFFCLRAYPITKDNLTFNYYVLRSLHFFIKNIVIILIFSLLIIISYLLYIIFFNLLELIELKRLLSKTIK